MQLGAEEEWGDRFVKKESVDSRVSVVRAFVLFCLTECREKASC